MIIDVSYYNQITDWKKVKANVDGIILRLGYTGYGSGTQVIDKKYMEYLGACINHDIPIGVYYFPQSITASEAEKEADFIYNNIINEKIALGVWLDSEIADVKTKNGRADKLNRDKRTEFLHIIIDRLKSRGIIAGVYASTSWLNNQLDMSKLAGAPVWVAQYNTKCTYQGTYIMWQYTSKGSIPGIAGNVDLNRLVNVPDPVEIADDELTEAVDVLAKRVIAGRFGDGHEIRKNSIYNLIRQRVNDILK